MKASSWGLFALVSLPWGVPYLFIGIALRDIGRLWIAAGRVAIAALVIVPSCCIDSAGVPSYASTCGATAKSRALPHELLAALDTRAWLLFAAMAVLWGAPYLFISVAVESYSPAAVVAGRTLLGAVILLPFAIRQKALRPAFAKIGWALLFGAIEMAGPFLLLGHAEQTLPSGLRACSSRRSRCSLRSSRSRR